MCAMDPTFNKQNSSLFCHREGYCFQPPVDHIHKTDCYLGACSYTQINSQGLVLAFTGKTRLEVLSFIFLLPFQAFQHTKILQQTGAQKQLIAHVEQLQQRV